MKGTNLGIESTANYYNWVLESYTVIIANPTLSKAWHQEH